MTTDYKFGIGSEVWPGLAKLMEEAGEVLQLLGKIVARGGDLDHTWTCKSCSGSGFLGPVWDEYDCSRCGGRGYLGSGDLSDALHEELGDLEAALAFLIDHNDEIDRVRVNLRREAKLTTYNRWHRDGAFLPPRPSEDGA